MDRTEEGLAPGPTLVLPPNLKLDNVRVVISNQEQTVRLLIPRDNLSQKVPPPKDAPPLKQP
jgi:hypothetical protein